MKRHHYELRAPGAEPRLFHTFAEADAAASEVLESAKGDGGEVRPDGYWRWVLEGGSDGRAGSVALDDAGLVDCGAGCPGG
ncbi:MAG TPA: hypothetical protein VE990_09205 [Acidimicrobiales bacterium]|nr:hypothetical protein [Acidimicrobiales bacterium]